MQLKLRADDSTIAVTGNLPLLDRGAPGTITIDAQANLATLARYAPVGTDIAADGRLTLTGTLQGTLKAIDPNLTITVADGLILYPAIEPGLSNLNATATIANGETTVDQLTANWGSALINLSARVPLDLLPELPVEIPRKGGPATIHASLEGLDPSAIPGAPAGLSGRISFDADLSSRRPNIREAEGKITFSDLQLGFNGLAIEQKTPSTVSVRNGIASIDQFTLGGSVGTLAAAGTVGLAGDRPLNVNLDGALNIAAISIVTDAIRAEGESIIDVSATGTLADPILSGNVVVRDGTVVMNEPRIAAEAVNARIDLNQDRVTLSSLTADVNGGTFTGKGGLAIRGGTFTDVDVELSARDFAFDAPLDLRSLSDSDIRITSARRRHRGFRTGHHPGVGPDRRHQLRHRPAGVDHGAQAARADAGAQPAAGARAVQRRRRHRGADPRRQQPRRRPRSPPTCASSARHTSLACSAGWKSPRAGW